MNYTQYKEIKSDIQKEINRLHDKRFELGIQFIENQFDIIIERFKKIGFTYDDDALGFTYFMMYGKTRLEFSISEEFDSNNRCLTRFKVLFDTPNDNIGRRYDFTSQEDFDQIPKILNAINREFTIFLRDEKIDKIIDDNGE